MNENTALRLKLAFIAWGYVGTSLQMVAAYAGIREYTDWHWAVCVPLAIAVGWTPLVGSGIAIYGAIYAWGWHWLPASVVFGWMLLLLPVAVYGKFRARRGAARQEAS